MPALLDFILHSPHGPFLPYAAAVTGLTVWAWWRERREPRGFPVEVKGNGRKV